MSGQPGSKQHGSAEAGGAPPNTNRLGPRPKPPTASPGTAAQALGVFARIWLERLPFAADTPGSGHLRLRSLTGVLDTEPARAALAELLRFEALLLAQALEPRAALRTGTVRRAELTLTLLHGAASLAENAPGAGDPFDLTRAAEHLAGLPLLDDADPPHLPYVPPARPTRDAWTPSPATSATRSPAAGSTSTTTAWSSCSVPDACPRPRTRCALHDRATGWRSPS
ncbi:hypothetical protein ABZ752_03050 [Streptomyces roseifaciens]